MQVELSLPVLVQKVSWGAGNSHCIKVPWGLGLLKIRPTSLRFNQKSLGKSENASVSYEKGHESFPQWVVNLTHCLTKLLTEHWCKIRACSITEKLTCLMIEIASKLREIVSGGLIWNFLTSRAMPALNLDSRGSTERKKSGNCKLDPPPPPKKKKWWFWLFRGSDWVCHTEHPVGIHASVVAPWAPALDTVMTPPSLQRWRPSPAGCLTSNGGSQHRQGDDDLAAQHLEHELSWNKYENGLGSRETTFDSTPSRHTREVPIKEKPHPWWALRLGKNWWWTLQWSLGNTIGETFEHLSLLVHIVHGEWKVMSQKCRLYFWCDWVDHIPAGSDRVRWGI